MMSRFTIKCLLAFWSIVWSSGASHGAPSLEALEQAAVKAAAAHVADAVVQIRTIGGRDTIDGTLRADGPTSGLIISNDGYIVSSAFNFLEDPASILVTFSSGQQAAARLVATDHSRMLVLLKVDGAPSLAVAEFAPIEEVRVGQWAVAVGRTFRVDQTNLSVGIVSALRRMHGKALQTDAAVSTANYGGPLVDIRGRVLGILVPMAPQSTSEVAGVEWYDSGIGFAVPLAEISEAIERMKGGEDQHAGILGIGMLGDNPHDTPATIAAVRPNSPAGRGDLRKGDRIVEIDGSKIESQTDLRFALGPRYGGESVRIVAKRGDELLERTITLAGELPPFQHAFLGILPLRSHGRVEDIEETPSEEQDETSSAEASGDQASGESESNDLADEQAAGPTPQGVVVRMVFPGSPAAEAGIAPGDRITKIRETNISTIASAIRAMNDVAPDTKVTVAVTKGETGEAREIELTSAPLPTSIPSELPPGVASAEQSDATHGADNAQASEGETVDLKLPEFKQTCQVYVPKGAAGGAPLGVLLWLHAPGDANHEQTIRDWRSICDRDGLLLVVPTSEDPAHWERTEAEYLRRLLERVVVQYTVDPQRIVVHGQGSGGGAMAYLFSLAGRDLVRGVSTSSSPLPREIRVPANEPAQRLAILVAQPTGSRMNANIAKGLQELAEAGYPIATLPVADSKVGFSSRERESMARWIDSLDRF